MTKINKIRTLIPDITIRTSLIVGFPGETQDNFNDLIQGVKSLRFNHIGVFKYSDEEDTSSIKLPNKISEQTIEKRFSKTYQQQLIIAKELNQSFIGKTIEVLIEGIHEESELLWQGRHKGQAPEIDGHVIINDCEIKDVKTGDFVNVLITDITDFDLIGTIKTLI